MSETPTPSFRTSQEIQQEIQEAEARVQQIQDRLKEIEPEVLALKKELEALQGDYFARNGKIPKLKYQAGLARDGRSRFAAKIVRWCSRLMYWEDLPPRGSVFAGSLCLCGLYGRTRIQATTHP
jgi:hypothetical protein